jgi:hypothetical protein
MGSKAFLEGGKNEHLHNVPYHIQTLRDCSFEFVSAMTQYPPNYDLAGQASSAAVDCLNTIINEILRAREGLGGNYAGSQLESYLGKVTGSAVKVNSTLRSQYLQLAPGEGRLPVSAAQDIVLERLLQKIKHRRVDGMNYRIEPGGKHFVIVAADHTHGQKPDCVAEFDVAVFCDHCDELAASCL